MLLVTSLLRFHRHIRSCSFFSTVILGVHVLEPCFCGLVTAERIFIWCGRRSSNFLSFSSNPVTNGVVVVVSVFWSSVLILCSQRSLQLLEEFLPASHLVELETTTSHQMHHLRHGVDNLQPTTCLPEVLLNRRFKRRLAQIPIIVFMTFNKAMVIHRKWRGCATTRSFTSVPFMTTPATLRRGQLQYSSILGRTVTNTQNIDLTPHC